MIPPRLTKKDAKITGTKAFRQPNRTAPDILARTSMLKLTGASSSLSKERPLLSNVMVTASMEVVQRMLIAIKPGAAELYQCFQLNG